MGGLFVNAPPVLGNWKGLSSARFVKTRPSGAEAQAPGESTTAGLKACSTLIPVKPTQVSAEQRGAEPGHQKLLLVMDSLRQAAFALLPRSAPKSGAGPGAPKPWMQCETVTLRER